MKKKAQIKALKKQIKQYQAIELGLALKLEYGDEHIQELIRRSNNKDKRIAELKNDVLLRISMISNREDKIEELHALVNTVKSMRIDTQVEAYTRSEELKEYLRKQSALLAIKNAHITSLETGIKGLANDMIQQAEATDDWAINELENIEND